MLNLSEEFHKVKGLANKGIEVEGVKLNLDKMMKSKDKAVTVLTKGVEFLFKKNKVTYFKGYGSFKSQNEILIKDNENKETIIQSEKTIIATGSVATSLPGIEIDEQKIVSSTGALKLEKVPNKMVVVGGGYIGLEMGSVWSRLGAEVEVVEFLDHITPGMDKEISSEFMKILKKQGIKFNMQNKVETIKQNKSGVVVSTVDKEGNKNNFESDVVLISVGRKANTEGLNLETIGVELDDRKRIKTDKSFKTNLENIYAIGANPLIPGTSRWLLSIAQIIDKQPGSISCDIETFEDLPIQKASLKEEFLSKSRKWKAQFQDLTYNASDKLEGWIDDQISESDNDSDDDSYEILNDDPSYDDWIDNLDIDSSEEFNRMNKSKKNTNSTNERDLDPWI